MIISCPNCGKRLEVQESLIGKQGTCPACKHAFTLAAPAAAAPPPLADLASAVTHAAPPERPPAAPNPASALLTPCCGGPLLTVARGVMVLGLVIVLVARGCDSIGARSIARAHAKLGEAKQQFEQKWTDKLDGLRESTDKLTRVPRSPAGMSEQEMNDMRRQREEASTAMEKAQEERAKEERELRKGPWRELEADARNASQSNAIQAYWREWAFLAGTIILVLGLLGVSFMGTWPERVLCLLMTAIIAFSVYIAGVAWLSSAVMTLKPS